MPWTFYTSSGEALTSFGPVALTDLDIDGGTAIGEAVVGADLFIMDNGAGGTNVKVTATEIATFIGTSLIPKAWVSISTAGAKEESQGIASIGDDATGDRDVNFTTAFAAADTYAVAGGLGDGASHGHLLYKDRTTADVNIMTLNTALAAADRGSSHAFYGAQ